MAEEAAREDEAHDAVVAPPHRYLEQLRVDPPGDPRRLQPPAAVALALALGDRVDDVVGSSGRLEVGLGEVLPDEPPDHPNPSGPQLRELVELVVLIAEDDLDRVVLDPRARTRPAASRSSMRR